MEKWVSSDTLGLALNAIVYLYRHALKQELSDLYFLRPCRASNGSLCFATHLHRSGVDIQKDLE
jgi:hypothetical protein